jgi:hypothetical protein
MCIEGLDNRLVVVHYDTIVCTYLDYSHTHNTCGGESTLVLYLHPCPSTAESPMMQIDDDIKFAFGFLQLIVQSWRHYKVSKAAKIRLTLDPSEISQRQAIVVYNEFIEEVHSLQRMICFL